MEKPTAGYRGHRVRLLKSGASDVSVCFVFQSLLIFQKHWALSHRVPTGGHWLPIASRIKSFSQKQCSSALTGLVPVPCTPRARLWLLSSSAPQDRTRPLPLSSPCPLSMPGDPSYPLRSFSWSQMPSILIHPFFPPSTGVSWSRSTDQPHGFMAAPSRLLNSYHPSSCVSSTSFLHWERLPEPLPSQMHSTSFPTTLLQLSKAETLLGLELNHPMRVSSANDY